MLKIAQISVTSADINKNVLDPNWGGVVRLGISGPTKTTFKIGESGSEIQIGPTGVYYVDLLGHGIIKTLIFTDIAANAKILIDAIYEGAE